MCINILQVNEAASVTRPLPLLISNPIYKGDSAMTKSSIL